MPGKCPVTSGPLLFLAAGRAGPPAVGGQLARGGGRFLVREEAESIPWGRPSVGKGQVWEKASRRCTCGTADS